MSASPAPGNPARYGRRPGPAAAEAVLLALASPRAPLVATAPDAGGLRVLTIAGSLRIARLRDGRIVGRTLGADGRWRNTDAGRCGLIDVGGLIEFALERMVDLALADVAGTATTHADRTYVARRLRADRYPDADDAHAQRAVRHVLRTFVLDRDVLRATCLIFGRQARLADYNDVVLAGAATLASISRETPNLAPLMGATVRQAARRGAARPSRSLIGQMRRALMSLAGEDRLAQRDWKWLSHQTRSAVAALTRTADGSDSPTLDALAVRLFAAAGLAHPPAALIGLTAPGGALQRALATVRAAASPGNEGPSPPTLSLARGGRCASRPWWRPESRLDDLARLVRVAGHEWLAREARGQGTRFLRDDMSYLVDWWLGESEAAPIVPRNATFSSLIRRQQRWHQLVILKHPEFLQQWGSAVPAHERGGVRFVPLTDSLMLAREGMEMRHCVASFARDCAAGHTRIFALECTDSGERATLELRRRASTWFTGQLKGACNGEVSDTLRGAAERLAQRYTLTASRP